MNSTSSSAQHLFSTVIPVEVSTLPLLPTTVASSVAVGEDTVAQSPSGSWAAVSPSIGPGLLHTEPCTPHPLGQAQPTGAAPRAGTCSSVHRLWGYAARSALQHQHASGESIQTRLCSAEVWGWMSSARSSRQPPVWLRVFWCMSVGTVNTFSPPSRCAAQGPWRPEINLLHIYFNTFPPSRWFSRERTLDGGNQDAITVAGDTICLTPARSSAPGSTCWWAAAQP